MTAADYVADPAADLRLLVPIGMPLGLQHPDGDPRTIFRVRLGRSVHALDDDMLGAWFLAHTMRHNRPSLAAAMVADGVADPIAAIESLIAGGLLVDTDVSTEGALLLTSAYQLVPLMTGLFADDEGGCIVGVPGVVEREVGEVFYQVFSRSTSSPSMLDAMVAWLAESPSTELTLDVAAARLLGQLGEGLEHSVVALDKATGSAT